MGELIVSGLCIGAKNTTLVEEASFDLKPGELIAVLGPNGAGKTSLLRGALGLIPVAAGQATLNGTAISALNPMARAQSIAYLPQARPLAWPNCVRDVVALGRFAHGATLGRLAELDAAAVDAAIAACDIAHLAARQTDTLSGGELARVHCARAFAAKAPLLIADEPVAALDPRHQFRIMDLIRGFVDEGGGAMVVLHDVALAARYADRLIWMKGGKIVADGPPSQTLTVQRMQDIYGVNARIEGATVVIEGAL